MRLHRAAECGDSVPDVSGGAMRPAKFILKTGPARPGPSQRLENLKCSDSVSGETLRDAEVKRRDGMAWRGGEYLRGLFRSEPGVGDEQSLHLRERHFQSFVWLPGCYS